VFLVSTVWQFRWGRRAQSFPMHVQWFVPVSIVSGFTSGLAGAGGLLVNPFYLNYGLIRESLLATRAVNSRFIQIAKLGTYGLMGAFAAETALDGLIAGAGALLSIWLSRIWLALLSHLRFRPRPIAISAVSSQDPPGRCGEPA
jgi:uncharacterized membrane protein YfcA